MKKIVLFFFLIPSVLIGIYAFTVTDTLKEKVLKLADEEESKVIQWRRDFHEHPELGNREFNTAEKIAAHLTSLGLEVKTGVAHTGVVALLKGGKPGPVIALRADMDALPVVEKTALPFSSKVTTTFNGQSVGVMHACGHDSHMAILMGVAEVLSKVKSELKGSVKFIFQPAEEGSPAGEEGGAYLMVKEGVLENPKVDVIYGLHINTQTEVGKVKYRTGGMMASVDYFKIKVKGKSAHGAYPWQGTDPVVAAAQIVNNIQTIVSRQLEITKNPAVVTIGRIDGGVRFNIIPEEVEMEGTIRALSVQDQEKIHERLRKIATLTAESQGATAEIVIEKKCPIVINDAALTEKAARSLQASAGKENTFITDPHAGGEDFSFYQEKVPGFFFFLGGMTKGTKVEQATSHHAPDFYIDEKGFKLGVIALCNLVIDYHP